MVRGREQLGRRSRFDHASEVHDDDAVADVPHDSEVVTDEQIGQIQRRAQIHEQVEDLRLDRHVEGSHRLVADQKLGFDRQRPRDADAGTLSAGELVRKAPHQRRVEADAIELQPDVFDLLPLNDQAVHHRRLADQVDDG